MLQNHVLTSRTSDFETFHYSETREKNMKFLSGCLGYQKFWYHEYILIIRGSEILNTFLYCLWIKNLESAALFGGSEILNLLCFFGVRNSESSPVLFGGSEILNFLCCFGVRNSESSPVLLGGSESVNPLQFFCRGFLGESDILIPLLWCLGDQKFWMLSCVFVGDEI